MLPDSPKGQRSTTHTGLFPSRSLTRRKHCWGRGRRCLTLNHQQFNLPRAKGMSEAGDEREEKGLCAETRLGKVRPGP